MQKEIKNIEFVQGVNFEIIDSLKNNGTKYLLISDDSCEENCNSKAFVDIATARGHRGLSTIYINHNFFHQSAIGRDFELQNTHIVHFKSPRDVMQVTTLGAQLGLDLELVGWYRDATSVLFGHLLIGLICRCGQMPDYVIAQTVESKFYIPDRLKHLRIWTMNTQNLPTVQMFQSLFRNCKTTFFSLAQKSLSGFHANTE